MQLKLKNKILKCMVLGLFVIISIIILFPIAYQISNSFMSTFEINKYYLPILEKDSIHSATVHFIPNEISLEGYYNALLRTPNYLLKFWNSLLMCSLIVAGQIIISCMGGYAFAKYQFPHKKMLFYLLIVLMMMPIQVTLVPNYIVLDKFNLLSTIWSLILPAMFLPFGTFFTTQIFKNVPDEVISAAQIDGAGLFDILTKIMMPMCKNGIICLGILSFIDAWNMVEQPLTFLKNVEQYPFSVFLASTITENFPVLFVCGTLAVVPIILIFIFFNDELISGLEFSGIK